jgi:hypothetical protein
MLVWDPPSGGRRGRVAFTMIGTTSPLVAQMAEDMTIEPLEDGVMFHWNVLVEPTALGQVIRPIQKTIFRTLFGRSMRGLAARTEWSAGRLAATHGA